MRVTIKRARRGLLHRNQWTFVITARNGEVVATGETYNNRQDCNATVQLLRDTLAESDTVVQQ